MLKQSIKKNIATKIETWLATINHTELRQQVKDSIFVSGGAIASMLMDEKVNDYDVYLTNKQVALRLTQYYCDIVGVGEAKETEQGVEAYIRSSGFYKANAKVKSEAGDKVIPLYISSNVITLSNGVQLILRFVDTPENIHGNFDYVHCTNYYDVVRQKLHINEDAVVSLLTKSLKYTGSKYPVCSLVRMRKFIRRGFTINAGDILKMVLQCNDLDLRDMKVLKDQLTGVDSAYFNMFLARIEKDKA